MNSENQTFSHFLVLYFLTWREIWNHFHIVKGGGQKVDMLEKI